MLKLVGDNPFHGVSHVSQERAYQRGLDITKPEYASRIVKIALDNGANGFMFSVSQTTLSVLKNLKGVAPSALRLYAITPAAGEFARLMGSSGGVEGSIKGIAKQILASRNIPVMTGGLVGALSMDWERLLRSYLRYETSRIRQAGGKSANLESIMLHEIFTDMVIGLGLKQVFTSYVSFLIKEEILPGFQTRNFVYLVNKLKEWDIDISRVSIAAPFNTVGFQMTPSRVECEKILANDSSLNVLAISVLAAGYSSIDEASSYVKSLANLKGIAIGISKETQARETFKRFN